MSLKKILGISSILKISAGIISLFIGLLTLGFTILGIRKAYHAASLLIEFLQTGDQTLHVGIHILDTLDIFLIDLVFLIFTIGIVQLFIKHDDQNYLNSLPKWLIINNLSELKFLLMQTIIVTLFVYSISVLVENAEQPAIDWLYVPGVILLLSISLALLMRAEHKKEN